MDGKTEQRYAEQLVSKTNNRRAAMHYRNAAEGYWRDGMKHEAGIALRLAQLVELQAEKGEE
jgi:hypothetical protein